MIRHIHQLVATSSFLEDALATVPLAMKNHPVGHRAWCSFKAVRALARRKRAFGCSGSSHSWSSVGVGMISPTQIPDTLWFPWRWVCQSKDCYWVGQLGQYFNPNKTTALDCVGPGLGQHSGVWDGFGLFAVPFWTCCPLLSGVTCWWYNAPPSQLSSFRTMSHKS